MKKYVILAAAGSGSRMNLEKNKIFLILCGQTVLERSMRLFDTLVDGMVIVHRPEDRSEILSLLEKCPLSFTPLLVEGGHTRQESVLKGLQALSCEDDDLILVHDAARCLTDRSLIESVMEEAISCGACVPGVPAVNTIKICRNQFVQSTPDRSALYEIQTPQAFRAADFATALCQSKSVLSAATDDASLLEAAGFPVAVVPGSRKNIKITTQEDLMIARCSLQNSSSSLRVGTGYDVHRLVEGRKLFLCGVEIPYEKGLLGHSDADVALHALMDAMLGAAALGDIGKFFPDHDAKFKDVSSLLLLSEVNRVLLENGFRLLNADITIVAQRPKLAPYIPAMCETIALTLCCDSSQVSVKATTTESLGFEGRQEGISSQAVCLLTAL